MLLLYFIHKFELVGDFQECIANINAIVLAKDVAITDDNVIELKRTVHPGDSHAKSSVFVIGRRPYLGGEREFTVV